jgi:hypothetical protein
MLDRSPRGRAAESPLGLGVRQRLCDTLLPTPIRHTRVRCNDGLGLVALIVGRIDDAGFVSRLNL